MEETLIGRRYAGVRFDVGDLTVIYGRVFFYLGENERGYSVFHCTDGLNPETLVTDVEWNSPTIFEHVRLPRLSSIRKAKG